MGERYGEPKPSSGGRGLLEPLQHMGWGVISRCMVEPSANDKIDLPTVLWVRNPLTDDGFCFLRFGSWHGCEPSGVVPPAALRSGRSGGAPLGCAPSFRGMGA